MTDDALDGAGDPPRDADTGASDVARDGGAGASDVARDADDPAVDAGGDAVGGGPAVEAAVDAYREAKAKGAGSGNYRALAESVLPRWTAWLADRGVTTVDAVTDQTMRRYA